jgi:hypothetical protein
MESIFIMNKAHRSVKFQYTHINWDKHLEQLRHTNTFQSCMHMKEESFDKLVNLLRDDITVDEIQSRRSTGGNDPIYPEVIAATGLQFLGGEYPKTLAACSE